jgi:hypothetical protein
MVINAPPNFLIESNANPKVKIIKEEGIEVRSLACNTSGIERHVGILGWGLGRVTSGSIIHIDLHKQNNELVNA